MNAYYILHDYKNIKKSVYQLKKYGLIQILCKRSFDIQKILLYLISCSDNTLDNTTEPNGTVHGDRCAKITDGRNSITASGRRFVQRRQESSATWNESRFRIRKGNDVVGKCEKEEGDANRRCCHTSTERCSSKAQNSSSKCNLRSSGSNVKIDKKLGNVFAPWSRPEPARPGCTSYSELYRRRFGQSLIR